MNEKEKALHALERAGGIRSGMLPLLKTEPSLTALHNEPRFQALARRIGIP